MAKFIKRIMSPGTYSVPGKDGSRRRVFVSQDRIKSWVDNFNKMTSSGLQIPAPWRHDPESKPIRTDADVQDTNSKDNAGWWKKLWVEEDGTLYGELEVPNRSDAAKVGKTVTEVSPLVMANWEDGLGKRYQGESCTHIALVTHPIVPNQENFQPAESLALSQENFLGRMDLTSQEDDDTQFASDMETTEKTDPSEVSATGASLSQALPILRKLGLALPKDTDESNFAERIIVAALAINSAKEKDASEDMEDEPSNSKEQPSPIAMSQETKLSKKQESMLSFAQNLVAKDYDQRVKRLIETGRITPRYAEEKIAPLLNNLTVEFSSEGELVPGPLDLILDACESIPEGSCLTNQNQTSARKNAKGETPLGQSVAFSYVDESHPDDNAVVGEDDDESTVRSLLESAGYIE